MYQNSETFDLDDAFDINRDRRPSTVDTVEVRERTERELERGRASAGVCKSIRPVGELERADARAGSKLTLLFDFFAAAGGWFGGTASVQARSARTEPTGEAKQEAGIVPWRADERALAGTWICSVITPPHVRLVVGGLASNVYAYPPPGLEASLVGAFPLAIGPKPALAVMSGVHMWLKVCLVRSSAPETTGVELRAPPIWLTVCLVRGEANVLLTASDNLSRLEMGSGECDSREAKPTGLAPK